MRSKISTPEVQPRSSVAVVLHLSRWKQILLVYQSYMRMSTWQPDVKLIQATLTMHEGEKKGKTFSLRRKCFCEAAQNRAENPKNYYRVQINRLNQVNLLGLSQPSSLLASNCSRRMMVHYWLTWCYISVWSYVTVLLQGLSLTADYSLRYLSELHWINYLPAELWHFPGLYDRWQPHPPSISLSPFSPLPLLIQNLSFAKGKKKKQTHDSKSKSCETSWRLFNINTRRIEGKQLSRWVSILLASALQTGRQVSVTSVDRERACCFYTDTSTCHHIISFLARVPTA